MTHTYTGTSFHSATSGLQLESDVDEGGDDEEDDNDDEDNDDDNDNENDQEKEERLLLSRQSESLQSLLPASATLNDLNNRKHLYQKKFLHADYVYCSPLTRAIETALVGK